MTKTLMLVLMILLCLPAGFGGIYWVKRRRFWRRNVAGLEEFPGYGTMLLTSAMEKLVMVACYCVLIPGIGAVILLLIRLTK